VSRRKNPVDDVRVERMGPVTMSDGKPGFGMTLTGAREIIHRIAEASVTFFEGEGGVNYVEFTVHHDTKGSFVHRIQRLEGKTPHELRRDAEQEAARLRATLEAGADAARTHVLHCNHCCGAVEREVAAALSQGCANTGETQATERKVGK
jgi:hypothetical protein